MRTLKVTLVSCLFAAAVWAAEAATVTKEATGEAAIVNGKEDKAFEEAKNNALRTAVEQAAGVMIQADTLTLNSQLIQDRVFANSQGYVKKYDVVSKKKEKGVISVTVKAEIGTADLDKDLQAVRGVVSRLGRSRLIVVLQEQSIDKAGISTKSEVLAALVTESFKKDGWKIVDEKGVGQGGEKFKLSAGVGTGTPDAKEIAKLTDVDYVVYGTVALRHAPPTGMGDVNERGEQIMFLLTGEYDLAMFEVRSGSQLAKVTGKIQLQNLTEAQKSKVSPLKSYAQTAHDLCVQEAPRIVASLRNPVLEYLRNQDVNGAAVVMKVSGLSGLDAVEDFQKSVGSVKNVRDVKTSGDFEDGKITLTVSFLGSAMDLGKALDKTLFKKKKISVKSVRHNEVELAIAK